MMSQISAVVTPFPKLHPKPKAAAFRGDEWMVKPAASLSRGARETGVKVVMS